MVAMVLRKKNNRTLNVWAGILVLLAVLSACLGLVNVKGLSKRITIPVWITTFGGEYSCVTSAGTESFSFRWSAGFLIMLALSLLAALSSFLVVSRRSAVFSTVLIAGLLAMLLCSPLFLGKENPSIGASNIGYGPGTVLASLLLVAATFLSLLSFLRPRKRI